MGGGPEFTGTAALEIPRSSLQVAIGYFSQPSWPFVSKLIEIGSPMKEPGLDGRHRDKDGQIQQKRSDTQNKNIPQPIPGFTPNTTLKQIREKTGQTSEKAIREAVKKKP